MSARMQYPLSQRRHTNIAVVRYQKNGVRLEIACYKNKVISYRSGTEDRLDEVLQVDRVFSNVARGYVASKEDIAAVFGDDMTEEGAIKYMLEHGELQVAQQERTAEVDEIFKDIALIISQKCVNTKTQRPFPTVVIEQALKSIGAGVKLDQPVKKQALGLIHQLVDSQIIPIARANMKVRCLTPSEEGLAALEEWCASQGAQVVERKVAVAGAVEDGHVSGADEPSKAGKLQHSLLILLPPNLFRDLDTLVKSKLPAGSSMHMIDAAAMEVSEGDANVVARAAAATALSSAGGEGGSLDLENNEPQRQRGRRGKSLASSSAASDDDDDDDDDAARSKKGKGTRNSKKARAKPSGKGRRGGGDDSDESDGDFEDVADDSDSAADDARTKGRKGETGRRDKDRATATAAGQPAAVAVAGSDALTAELMKLGLDPAKDLAGAEDSDDEGRGKGKKGKAKGKGKGKANNAPPPPPQQQQPANTQAKAGQETDSDEELAGNRRQRKKNTQQQQQKATSFNPSDEEFDYGEDEEDAAEN